MDRKSTEPPPLPSAAQVPAELLPLKRWCGWRAVWDEDKRKFKKPPHSPLTGQGIGATEEWRDHWLTFDEALAGAKKHGLTGVGFCFHRDDGYIGVDFDGCIHDGKLDPGVEIWLRWLPGYHEVSPSGTGLHAIVKGTLSKNHPIVPLPDSNSAIELYFEKRFFTFTGQVWGDPCLAIENAQIGIEKLLKHVGVRPDAEEGGDETSEAAAVAYLGRVCDELSKMTDGRQRRVTQVCWWLGRVIGGKPGDPRLAFDAVKARITAALEKTGWESRKFEVIERQLHAGMGHPVKLVSREEEHDAALARLQAEIEAKAFSRAKDDVLQDTAQLTPAEYETIRKGLAALLNWRPTVLDKDIARLRKKRTTTATIEAPQHTILDPPTDEELPDIDASRIKPYVRLLLDLEAKDRRKLNLPISADSVKLTIATLVWKHLSYHAEVFFCGGLGYLVLHGYEDQPLKVSIEDHNFSNMLAENYGLRTDSEAMKAVACFINEQCAVRGTHTEVALGFKYDHEQNVAYVSHYRGYLLRISKDSVTQAINGDERVLFFYADDFCEWRLVKVPRPKSAFAPLDELFKYIELEEGILTQGQQQTLLMSSLMAQLLPGVTVGRPLVLFLGDTGSGKTFIVRSIGRLLTGPKFDVCSPDTDMREMENKLVNNSYVGIDDVDHLNTDARGTIRRAVTGGKVVRRELFTTMGQIERPFIANIALTGIKNPFGDEETANRSLVFTTKPRTEFKDEKDLQSELDACRDRMMSSLVARVQLILEAIEQQRDFRPAVRNRMASFAVFLLRVARHEGWEDAAQNLLDALRLGQEDEVIENSELAQALTETLCNEPKGSIIGCWLSSKELWRHIVAHIVARPYPYWAENEIRLSHALRRSLGVFSKRFGYRRAKRMGRHYHRFALTDDQLKKLRKRPKGDPDQMEFPEE